MAVNVSRGTYIAIKAETTYGTAVTPDRFLRVTSANLNMVQQIEPSPELAGATGSLEARYRYQLGIEAGGDVEMLAMYEGGGVLWEHLMRATVTTQADTPSSGNHTHTLHLGVTRSSLTMELVRGSSFGGTTYAETFEGSVAPSWTMSATVGQPLKLSFDVIAETTAGPAGTPTSPTFTTNHLPLLYHQGTIVWNGVTYKCRAARIGVRHGVERLPAIGSKLTQEPVITAPPVAFMELEILAEAWSAITGQQASTSATATVTCTNGTQSFAATLRSVAWKSSGVSHADNGPAYITVSGEALGSSSASTPGLSVVFINTQSTFTAA